MERLLSALIFLAKVRDANPNRHEYRIRCAKKARDAIDAFIVTEVRTANSKSVKDPTHLSWARIGEALDLSRSAAFTRYGKKEESGRGIRQPERAD